MSLATPRPRSIIRVNANGRDSEAIELIGRINAAVSEMRTNNDSRLSTLERHQDEIAQSITASILGAHGGDAVIGETSEDREYRNLFASYAMRGDAEAETALKRANAADNLARIHADMSVGDNSSGGYIAPIEWDRQIRKAQRTRSPMRRLAKVVMTRNGGYSTLWNDDQWASGWVSETAARPKTGTPTFSAITFASGEIYANPAITQRLIDDAEFDVAGWVAEELSATFERQESLAFISGDGTNKPMGFLQYVTGGAAASTHPGGVLDVVASGHASSIPTADILISFKYGLAAPYRQNASWLMSSGTAAVIAKMKDGNGQYLWREGLAEGQPSTLLGRPVEIDENMPEIGAGNLAIAFGDFAAGYVVNDRFGTRILRDPYTNKPYVMFYATKRVGGGVMDPRAIRLLKIAAS